jgi:hypothetical protein
MPAMPFLPPAAPAPSTDNRLEELCALLRLAWDSPGCLDLARLLDLRVLERWERAGARPVSPGSPAPGSSARHR